MKNIKTTIAMLFLGLSNLMAQTSQESIIGTWETDAKDAQMEVFKKGDMYYGKLLWGDKVVETDGKTSKKDDKNSDKKLRTRNIIGIVNLTGLKFKDGEFTDGKIYDPTSGQTYSCKAWIENGKLNLRGFIGFSLLGKTASWRRLK
jgi:uncharacterized protein (DUF2147 family)